jgi:pyruvate ferredoxin oxidoreductase alpha subunit
MRGALEVWEEIDRNYLEAFGRGGNPFVEAYRCEDAEFIVIAMGSLSYQLRDVVDIMREEGRRIGVVGVRMLRPFPAQAIVETLASAQCVIVMEKALSYGNQGALTGDIKAALYRSSERPLMHHFILGLGGREIKTRQLYDTLTATCASPETVSDAPVWIGLKL